MEARLFPVNPPLTSTSFSPVHADAVLRKRGLTCLCLPFASCQKSLKVLPASTLSTVGLGIRAEQHKCYFICLLSQTELSCCCLTQNWAVRNRSVQGQVKISSRTKRRGRAAEAHKLSPCDRMSRIRCETHQGLTTQAFL